ncbi:hypothetical protein ACTFIU_008566 [Dictyostelium citrinum]
MKVPIIIVIILSIIISSINCVVPPIDQYNCLVGFISKFNLQSLYNKINSTHYDFCAQNAFSCDETGSVTGFSVINSRNSGYNNQSILPSDLTCISTFNRIILTSFNISNELVFYNNFIQIVHERTFDYGNYECGPINQKFPQCRHFLFSCKFLAGTTLKLSYIQNSYFLLQGSHPYVENDVSSNNSTFFYLSLWAINYPDMSNIQPIDTFRVVFDKNFINSSISNFPTIKANNFQIQHHLEIQYPFYLNSNPFFKNIYCDARFEKPRSFFDFSTHYYQIMLLSRVGNEFNINGEIPIIPYPKSFNTFFSGSWNAFPNLTVFDGDLAIGESNLSFILPKYIGKNQHISLVSNNLTGQIDESWCNSYLIVENNKLSGDVPLCFSCYFSDSLIFNNFNGNQFTNYNQSLGCPKFAPRFKKVNDSNGVLFLVTGENIGYSPNYWLLNSQLYPSSYIAISIGFEYLVYYSVDNSLNDEYFNITFTHPKPTQIYTFPVNESSPTPTGIQLTSTQLFIDGKFFSSYIGYSNQSVEFEKSLKNCPIKESSFFSITCDVDPSITLTYPTIIKIENDNFVRRVMINPQQGELNQLVCKNYCEDLENRICDLSKGVCAIECQNDCGPYGFCNYQTGACNCDSNHQGPNCSLPFKPCPVGSNSLICSGGDNNCNNQTGICSCNSKFTGDDCSKPNLYISSIIPSNTNGGEALFFGWFGDTRSNQSILIGIQKCQPITYNTSNEIKCIAPPGNGVYDITLKQDDIEYILRDSYRYDEIIKSCPNNCTNSNQGICNTSNGECKCINNYYSFDCSLKRNNNTSNNSTVNPSTGGTNITDNQVNFQIYFKNLFEIDFSGNIVNQYSLQSNWTFNKTKDSQSNNIFKLVQTIQQSCEIIASIEEISTPKQYSFAGTTFTLDTGSIKLTISISNYYYKSNLNTLQLQLISSADNNENQETDCNSKEVSTNEINTSSFKYIKISKDNRVLQGRFINKILSDGRPTYLSIDIKNESNSMIATLNLPHFLNQSIIDPDFSVLLQTDFNSECDTKNDRKWLIPVAVIIPVIGVCCIVVVAYLIYRKQFIEKPLNIKLAGLGR